MKPQNISISMKDKLLLISNLSTMISAGIPILYAVNSIMEDKKGNVRKILEVVKTDLLQGKPLHVSFAKFPRVFNKITISILKASEEAGTLDMALKELKGQIKKDIEFGNRVRSALTYPFLVLLVFIGVLLLILLFVMPKIATVFSQLKVKLPLPTKIMIATSNILIHYPLFVIAGILIVVVGIIVLYQAKREWILSAMYSIPVVSGLVDDIDLYNFSRSLHVLLSSGITITNALDLTQGVVNKKHIAKAIAYTRDTVLAGKNMSMAFKQRKKVFPALMVTLTETGEKTGSLNTAMSDIAEYFDGKVSDSLKTVVALLEPVMLVLVGLVVGSMMMAIIGPIYSLISNISPH